ncbi:Condensin complex subunit 2-like protein [Euroglyphus maynei]|uniref:Condensin complex subunit 2 n=1 Tax=Euroglyphus maynei TaxID=6958 RepID=A0A1Y3BRJ9_EURMA|nr:Condensin complex subunit 2-like protein [Euroglyphus maynei]
MTTSIDNYDGNSFISSPALDDGKRKVSLSRRALDSRKSLRTFDTDSNREQPIEPVDQREFCVHLNSLHEINSKTFNPSNAFKYNFINKIDAFLLAREMIDFKVIALSIDAGTKLYESKVGVVFSNTQKISSSLSMATNEQNAANFDDGIFDNDFGENNERVRRKKQRKNIKTIAANIESLNGKPETNIEIDPLFHHLSAAFDVGNVNSLLMANLSVNPHGTMLLDSKASLDFDPLPNVDSHLVKFPFLKPETAFEHPYIGRFCRNFEFLRRDIDIEPEELSSQRPIDTDTNLNFDFDINANVDDIHEPEELNFDDYVNSSIINESIANDNDSDTEDILKFLPKADEMKNQFFNREFLQKKFQNFVRYRNLNKTAARAKRRKAVHVAEDFNIVNKDLDKKFKLSSSSHFQDQTISKWINSAKEKFMDEIQRNFLKNDRIRSCFTINYDFHGLVEDNKRKNMDDDYDDGIIHEAFDDHVDETIRQHSDFNFDDDLAEERPAFDLDADTEPVNLDSEPSHVDALDIDYAKVAKKVDIKRVKSSMWSLIKQATVTDPITEEQVQSINTQSENDSQRNFSFFKLRQNLPFTLRQNLNENLSTPISFVALLHLCNEKNLKLTPDELSDFQIDAPILY